MKPLELELFKAWMQAYGKASEENDPQASANLFTPDAQYYKNPFDEPMIGRDAIYQYWGQGAQRLKDKTSSFEILTVRANLGIAHRQTNFTVIESGKQMALNCMFLVEFDESEKCSVFREWWHPKTLDAISEL